MIALAVVLSLLSLFHSMVMVPAMIAGVVKAFIYTIIFIVVTVLSIIWLKGRGVRNEKVTN